MTKRQSTTAKVTMETYRLIAASVRGGNGVIVRYRGEELGVVDTDDRGGIPCLVCDGESCRFYVSAKRCTIRKTTVETLRCIPSVEEIVERNLSLAVQCSGEYDHGEGLRRFARWFEGDDYAEQACKEVIYAGYPRATGDRALCQFVDIAQSVDYPHHIRFA